MVKWIMTSMWFIVLASALCAMNVQTLILATGVASTRKTLVDGS